jgi:hypothetical protein
MASHTRPAASALDASASRITSKAAAIARNAEKTEPVNGSHNCFTVLASQQADELGVRDALRQRQALHLTVVNQTQSTIGQEQYVA